MSAFYLDILKDRLYTLSADSPERRSSQTAMAKILDTLCRVTAPILTFTADEAFQMATGEREGSVHLADWPEVGDQTEDDPLLARYERLTEVRTDVLRGLEALRADKRIGNSLEATVDLATDDEGLSDFLASFDPTDLAAAFIVSRVTVQDSAPAGAEEGIVVPALRVLVAPSDDEKCGRCWRRRPDVGAERPEVCGRCASVLDRLGV